MKREMGIFLLLILVTVLMLDFLYLVDKIHYYNSLHLVLEGYVTKI